MNEESDAELLARFSLTGCEQSFTELVGRHINLVHSVAVRHTDDPHESKDITQAVFIILARKAHSMGAKTVVAGWLYQTARLTAANYKRAEFRRVRREQEAFMQLTPEGLTPSVIWSEMTPFLDEAMAELKQSDRDAVVLRYFENQSLKEVGKAMGVEERAVQKRISRALEKLRNALAEKGLTATTTILVAAISTHSVQAAPLGLASTISATALKGSAAAGSTLTLVKETIQMMTWIKTKTAVAIAGSALLACGVAASIVHHKEAGSAQSVEHTPAQREKWEAERAGAPGNVATDPNAQKAEDERRAVRASKQ